MNVSILLISIKKRMYLLITYCYAVPTISTKFGMLVENLPVGDLNI
jgi:hypothetical protein